MITAIRMRQRRTDLPSRWSSTGCEDTHSNAPCQRQNEPAMATLGGYLTYQHPPLPPTRRVIARPRPHYDPSHAPSPSLKSPSTPLPSAARPFLVNQTPIAECAAPSAHHLPRVRSLAAFGRRPPVLAAPISIGRHPKPSTKADVALATSEVSAQESRDHPLGDLF